MTHLRAPCTHRTGMTLVELLTVLVIVGVLAAMSIPALSLANARSQLVRCTSNQYQIADALSQYEDFTGSLPGWLNQSPDGSGPQCSWPVHLLRFLGRSDVADAWPSLYSQWPKMPNDPTIDVFLCPSNRLAASEEEMIRKWTPNNSLYPFMNYVGSAGATGTTRGDGVFLNRLVTDQTWSLDEIADADGLATTLAFSERKFVVRKDDRSSWPHTWRSTSFQTLFGSGTSSPPVMGVATPPGPTDSVLNAKASDVRGFAPSSGHRGGVVVAFCDGHTAFLSDSIEPYVYAQLLTPVGRYNASTASFTYNSRVMQQWLRLPDGTPYLLVERDLRKRDLRK